MILLIFIFHLQEDFAGESQVGKNLVVRNIVQ